MSKKYVLDNGQAAFLFLTWVWFFMTGWLARSGHPFNTAWLDRHEAEVLLACLVGCALWALFLLQGRP